MAAKPKLIALNAGLALGLVLIVWQGWARWNEAQAERRANLNLPVKRVTPPPMVPAQKPDAVQAAKYADVATKNLFSKDRNPTVIIEAPKVEPAKLMPPLPVVYGVMTLPDGTQALMAEHAGTTERSVRVGDAVGDFKILAMDSRKITFDWDGQHLERTLDELEDHSGVAAAAPANAAAGPAVPPPAPALSGPPTSAVFGQEIGTPDAPARACKPNDNSPSGTVVDGYRKSGVVTPFGNMYGTGGCNWVPSK